MDYPDGSSSSTPSNTPSEVEQVVTEQSKKFEEMKSMLEAQKQYLMQTLEQLEAVKTVPEGKSTEAEEPKADERVGVSSNKEERSSSSQKRFDIQICPICGAEFDDPNAPEALEDHVAAHWCSSESSGVS